MIYRELIGKRDDVQYVLDYNLKSGRYLTSSPIITANWKASSGNPRTVPKGNEVERIMRFGNAIGQSQCAVLRECCATVAGLSWSTRPQIAFLFPKNVARPGMCIPSAG